MICAFEAITEVSCSTVLLQCGSGPRSRHVNSPSQTTGMYVSLLSDSSKLQAMVMLVLAPVRPPRSRRSLVQAGRCFIYLALFAVGNLGTPHPAAQLVCHRFVTAFITTIAHRLPSRTHLPPCSWFPPTTPSHPRRASSSRFNCPHTQKHMRVSNTTDCASLCVFKHDVQTKARPN